MKFLQNKLSADIIWTMGSFVILAASGIIINLLVTWFRDVAALGVFNLAYAVYIISSQIAVLGLHYSVMRHAALYVDQHHERNKLMYTACLVSVFLGVVAALVTYFIAPFLGELFHSSPTGQAIKYSSLGLLIFPLNKVLMAFLNGLRAMKAYSIIQSLRYLAVMVWVVGVAASSYAFEYMTYGFFAAEFITTCTCLAYLLHKKCFAIKFQCFCTDWVKKHFTFGGKSLLAGMFVELNSRIDVLLLGVFLSEKMVGIYSFVAMLVDGLYHMIVVVRTNFNPVLVGVVRDHQFKEAKKLLKTAKTYVYPAAGFLSICIIGAFWILSHIIMPTKGLEEGMICLMVLCTCLTFISAFIPFDNLLMSSGLPGFQTIQHLVVIVSNILLNLLLVPIYGINGAAIATGMSYISGIMALVIFTRYFLGWNLLTNKSGGNAAFNVTSH